MQFVEKPTHNEIYSSVKLFFSHLATWKFNVFRVYVFFFFRSKENLQSAKKEFHASFFSAKTKAKTFRFRLNRIEREGERETEKVG